MNKEELIEQAKNIQKAVGFDYSLVEEYEQRLTLIQEVPAVGELAESGVPLESIVVVDN